MLRKLKAGEVSQSIPIFILDTTSITGSGLGSLVFNTSGLAAKYRRAGDSAWTTITLATMTLGTWATGGFISDGGVTGGYEFGIPNAVIAAGVEWAEIQIYGAANMLPVVIFIELDVVNYQSATAFITGINSLAPPAAWNTDIVQSGDAYARLGVAGVGLTNLGDARIANLDATISSRTKPADTQARVTLVDTVTTYTGNTPQTGDSFARLGVTGAGLTSLGDARIANLDTTVSSRSTFAGGAVASVTGSVGSVTAAVSTNPNAVENAIKAKTDNLPTSPAAVGSVMSLDLAQAIPTSNTAQTIGDAMNAARAQGFGRWKLVGNTLSLYGADGLTVVKTLTFDDTNSPTERK